MFSFNTTINAAHALQFKSFKLSDLAVQSGCRHPHGAVGWLFHTELGSWKAADPLELVLFHQLRSPLSWSELLALNKSWSPILLKHKLQTWYNLGFISLNGRLCADAFRQVDSATLGARFLALHMTSVCNLRCAYCYNASGHSDSPTAEQFLSADLACRFIEKACRDFNSPVLQIGFMGGEPMLAFTQMRRIIEQSLPIARSCGKELHFSVQTNGLHFDDNKLDFLRDYRVGVGISLDGPAAWHDKYRRTSNGHPTHQQAAQSFIQARRHGLAVSPLAVITAPEQMSEALRYFVRELQAFNIGFNICCPIGRGRYHFGLTSDSLDKMHKAYIEAVVETKRLSKECGCSVTVSDFQNRLRGLTDFRQEHMCLRSPCGLGTSILALDNRGRLYACEEYEPATQEAMCLGHLDSLGNLAQLADSNEKLRYLLSRNVNTIPHCKRCWLRTQCGGGCTHRALAQTGNILGLDPMCRFYKKIYPDLMWILAFI